MSAMNFIDVEAHRVSQFTICRPAIHLRLDIGNEFCFHISSAAYDDGTP